MYTRGRVVCQKIVDLTQLQLLLIYSTGTILSHARRGGFPRSNRPLRNDDPIRSNLHDGSRTLRLRAFPRQFPLLHDGIRLGTTQRGHAHVLPRRIHVQRSIPTVGHVGILHAVGTFGND